MARHEIVVVGSSNTDMIVRMGRIPRPGETILGGEFATAAGGKGANQAVAAARAGRKVAFIGRVGRDSLGDQALAGLERDGIDVAHVLRDPKRASGVALIFVAESGENSIAVAGGANGAVTPADVRRAAAAFKGARELLAQLETPLPAIQASADMAFAHGLRVILNPAPARPLPTALLRRVSILTPNETEAEILTGVKVDGAAAAARAAEKLLRRGVGTVIVTLGAKGALLAERTGSRIVPGFKVKAKDTTAAGDVFNGALAAALAEGRPMLEAVRFGCAAAAISVTRLGAQPSAPRRAEIERLLRH